MEQNDTTHDAAPSGKGADLETLIAVALADGRLDAARAQTLRNDVATGEWSLATARAYLDTLHPGVF